MLQQKEFYLRLPSDSSQAYFGKENTICCYRTKLPQQIQLHGDWEVALTDMAVPTEAENISDEEAVFFVKICNSEKALNHLLTVRDIQKEEKKWYTDRTALEDGKVLKYTMAFPSGNYASPYSLIKVIHEVFQDQFAVPITSGFGLEAKVKFAYEENGKQRVAIDFKGTDKKIEIGFQEPLLSRLGGCGDDPEKFSGTIKYLKKSLDSEALFVRPMDLNMGMNLLYVYTDIIQHNIVGNLFAPLLRVIPFKVSNEAKAQNGAIQSHYEFLHPQYLPLSQSQLDTIRISINGDMGQPIVFVQGKAVVTLHFRRKRTT